MADPGNDKGRQWERDVWYKSRFGARSDEPTPSAIRRFLDRPIRAMLILGALAIVVVFGSYAIFGYGDPPLTADNEAVAGTLEVDGTICCSTYREIDGAQYVFMIVLDDSGFFSTQSHDVSLRVARLDSAGSPEEVASLDAPFDSTLPRAMAIVGDSLYTPIGRGHEDPNGIWIVDVSNPASPEQIATYDTHATHFGYVGPGEGSVLIANSGEEMVFYDVADPARMEVISTLRRPDPGVRRVEIVGDRLYSHVTRAGQVRILDLADVTAVEPLGRHLSQSLTGQRMIAQPPRIATAEERLERAAPEGRYLDFTVSGNYLYIADSDRGVEIVDVSNPESTETTNWIDVDGRAVRVQQVDDALHVLVAGEDSRERVAYEVRTFDVSDPAGPALSEVIDGITAVPARQDMSIGGGYLLLAFNDTLLVLDTEN